MPIKLYGCTACTRGFLEPKDTRQIEGSPEQIADLPICFYFSYGFRYSVSCRDCRACRKSAVCRKPIKRRNSCTEIVKVDPVTLFGEDLEKNAFVVMQSLPS